MTTAKFKSVQKNKGQAAVELALTLPIVMMLMLGIIEGGWLMFVYTSLTTAGREASRYGAGVGSNGSGTDLYNDCAGIRAAALRIGQFAGITASDIHIYQDNGPTSTTRTEYCTSPTDTTTFTGNQRIDVRIDITYKPISPIGPFASFPLHSESAHTILMGDAVVAKPQTFSGGGQVCDVSKYSVYSESNLLGPDDTVLLKNASTADTHIVDVLIVWDTGNVSSGPQLLSINNYPIPNLDTISNPLPSAGPSYSSSAYMPFPVGYSQFTLHFSKSLKNPVIIRLTLEGDGQCAFGQ